MLRYALDSSSDWRGVMRERIGTVRNLAGHLAM